MATILEKDLTRETTIKIGGREIQITLTEDQKISMKLKGMKTGAVDVSIEDLYKDLAGIVDEPETVTQPKEHEMVGILREPEEEVEKAKISSDVIDLSDYKGDKKVLISLHDFRHAINVRKFEVDTRVNIDTFLSEFIKDRMEGKGLKS